MLAVPTPAAQELIARAGSRTLIDLSGALKQHDQGRYALFDGDQLLDGAPPRRGDWLANPGCFAGSVVCALQRSGLAKQLKGSIQITAVGGQSTAHPTQQGGLRLANRLLDHPHAQEIQRAVPSVQITNFTLMVAHTQPRGILSITTGSLTSAPRDLNWGQAQLDVQAVVETPNLLWKLALHGAHFTLASAIDNILFPVDNALLLIQTLSTRP